MTDGLTHLPKSKKQKQRYRVVMAHVDGIIEASRHRNGVPPTIIQLRAYSHRQAEFIANLRNSSMYAVRVELETTSSDNKDITVNKLEE